MDGEQHRKYVRDRLDEIVRLLKKVASFDAPTEVEAPGNLTS